MGKKFKPVPVDFLNGRDLVKDSSDLLKSFFPGLIPKILVNDVKLFIFIMFRCP